MLVPLLRKWWKVGVCLLLLFLLYCLLPGRVTVRIVSPSSALEVPRSSHPAADGSVTLSASENGQETTPATTDLYLEFMNETVFKCTNFSAVNLSASPLQWIVSNRPSFRSPCETYLPCGWTPQTFFRPTRIQASLQCEESSTSITFKEVSSDVVPSLTSVRDKACLKRIINNHCRVGNNKIPKVAHYVRFGNWSMTLDAFMGSVSVFRMLQPCLVLYHGDAQPSGPYWQALLQIMPNLVYVPMEKPTQIFNITIKVVEHSSDVARIRLMSEYGGVYLDKDYLLIRPLDDLLNYSMVMGVERPAKLCNAFFMAEAGAKFLDLWLANYTDFKDSDWAQHSTNRPRQIANDHPNLIHVEPNVFLICGFIVTRFYERNRTPRKCEWILNYGVHLYTRSFKKYVYGKPRLDKQRNVISNIVRHILYGNQHACLRLRKPKA